MCGIAGILHRRPSDSGLGWPVGSELLTMASCLQHRGSDSCGFVVFGNASANERMEVMIAASADLPEPKSLYELDSRALSNLVPTCAGFSAELTRRIKAGIEIGELASSIEALVPMSTVTGAGKSMTVRKAVGEAETLTSEVAPLNGSHGIAHLRLATESKIDPAHAQPFWARGFFDIAVTHNGHITNYHKLRKEFESRGYTFGSANDSEVIGIYLGEKMSDGLSFHAALTTASKELDGSFSFIAATENALGVARDPFATKPLLYCETDDLVALASEQQALHRLLGENIVISEIQPREVKVWERV